jgi:phosphatidylglycerophosphate synthase
MNEGSVRASHMGPATGLIAPVLLLAVLAGTPGLGAAGWIVGVACAVTMAVAMARGLGRGHGDRLGPASWVTLARATLAVGVAALAADSFTHDAPVALLVTLAAVALALDAADGLVARRTGTATALGARFDGEVDAFLILALSVYVAPAYGTWVLAIGAARYLFLAAEWLLPWMRAPLPPLRWRMLVAATQGVVLTVAAAGVLPRALMQTLLVAALTLLAASVGQCAGWLWRRRHAADEQLPEGDVGQPQRASLRSGIAVALTVLALLLVWAALVAPNQPSRLTLGAFARLPLELLVVVAVAALLPATPRRVLAVIVGAVLSALVLVKGLDIGFFTAFDRPFKPLDDSSYVGIGIETLRDAIGRSSANLVVAVAVVLIVALLALPILALLRVTRVAAGHRGWALRAVATLGVVWFALRAVGAPVASWSTAALAVDEVQAVRTALADPAAFAGQLADDRFRATPGNRLLTGLRGNDVLLVFVESYGRVAVQGSPVSPGVHAVLDRGTAQLRDAGFSSRSAFLTSPTFGGLSWLAHSTLQSGVRVDGQQRYDQLVENNRLTLTRAFKRARWRAVAAMPGNRRAWPEGSTFYRYDKIYDRRNLGYRGPSFGLPPMPDQYTFLALQRRELAKRHRPPLFAEVDLISSHAPWTRIPRLIPWDDVGDGSIFDRIPAKESTQPALFGDAERARAAYGHSIEYSLRTLFSFVQRYGDDNLVLVVLGDHQPATLVTGEGASHDVPISVIAHDPKVMDQIAGWGWQDGMLPSPQAPVWPMAAVRDRFLTAFGSSPASDPVPTEARP